MRRVASTVLVTVIALSAAIYAQAKPDFSGTWTLDAAKSDPAPAGRGGRGGGGGGGPVTIKQTATDITIGMATYKLDGSEMTMEGRGGPVKGKVSWQGANLVVETTRDFQGNSITTKEVRSLSPDGKEMTVVATTATPQGAQTRKTIFTKS